eukprot:6751359-Pyramimonas_sp.AAC.2
MFHTPVCFPTNTTCERRAPGERASCVHSVEACTPAWVHIPCTHHGGGAPSWLTLCVACACACFNEKKFNVEDYLMRMRDSRSLSDAQMLILNDRIQQAGGIEKLPIPSSVMRSRPDDWKWPWEWEEDAASTDDSFKWPWEEMMEAQAQTQDEFEFRWPWEEGSVQPGQKKEEDVFKWPWEM